jgi:kinesin family protein 2/24
MIELIEYAHRIRTTKSTTSNDTSSRSHAVCNIYLRPFGKKAIRKLSIVDLAGSERAQDCQSNNRRRKIEGAEINKSLLCLKECIRGLCNNAQHIPYRASKLTMVLRDSFVCKNKEVNKIAMIACISPGHLQADHSINTLKYADRLKDRTNVVKITRK